MRIACLQFAPKLGAVKENMDKADSILASTADLKVPEGRQADSRHLWLVLPEMAFSGYNFSSLGDVTPYLEPTCAGPTTQWATRTAQKYKAYVTAGYPEKSSAVNADGSTVNYNSIVTVSPKGDVLINYRKLFLYYTDETWASEGENSPKGFYAGDIEGIGSVSMGICMDINPYKFLAEWNKYEFANHVLQSRSQLVILSMAWLTRLAPQELTELPLRPDNETLSYWVERFYPLQMSTGQPVFLVFANRCGIEGSACYAGTSSILCFRDGRGYIYDMLGKWDEQCMMVDLQKPPKYELSQNALTITGQP